MEPGLSAVLRDASEAGWSFDELLGTAAARGLPLEAVLARVGGDEVWELEERDDGPFLWMVLDDGWVEALVAAVGGEAAADAVLERCTGWPSAHTVAEWRSLPEVRAELGRRSRDPSDPAGMEAAVAAARRFLPPYEVDTALRHVVGTWPIGAIARAGWLPVATQRALLPRRGGWPDLLDAAEAEVGPRVATAWIDRLLDEERASRVSDVPGADDARYLDRACRLREAAALSLGEPARRVASRAEPAVWLPILRRSGFAASQALLLLLDRGVPAAEAAARLAETGYGDGAILEALRANGVGPSRALDALRDAGWRAERMVASLRAAGLLDSEVREHLHHLGLPAARIAELLCTEVVR